MCQANFVVYAALQCTAVTALRKSKHRACIYISINSSCLLRSLSLKFNAGVHVLPGLAGHLVHATPQQLHKSCTKRHVSAERFCGVCCCSSALTRILLLMSWLWLSHCTLMHVLLCQLDTPASSWILDSAVAPSFVRCSVPFNPLSHNSIKVGSLNNSAASPARLLVSNLPPSSNTGCGSLDVDAPAAARCLLESIICVLSRNRAPAVLEKVGRVASSALAAL